MSGNITKGFVASLGEVKGSGMTGRVWMYNFIEWQAMVADGKVTVDADGVVTDITNAVGVQGFLFDLPRNSVTPSSPSSKLEGQGGFTHTVALNVPTLDQPTKNQFAELINRNLVVLIVESFSSIAPAMVYGMQSGLEASALDGARSDQNQANGLAMTLTTPTDSTLEPYSEQNVFDTDVATTRALLATLETPGA